jgi:single-strand DNA-binding protein
MASVNRIMLIGNLGQDPEMRYLPSGEAVANFSIATKEVWKDKQGAKQERTDWHRIEFIGRTAEIAGEYLKKGSQAYIEGSVRYDKWTDKEGVEKTLTKIRGDRLQLLGSRQGGGGDSAFDGGDAAPRAAPQRSAPSSGSGGASGAPAGGAKKSKLDDFDDDIPF